MSPKKALWTACCDAAAKVPCMCLPAPGRLLVVPACLTVAALAQSSCQPFFLHQLCAPVAAAAHILLSAVVAELVLERYLSVIVQLLLLLRR